MQSQVRVRSQVSAPWIEGEYTCRSEAMIHAESGLCQEPG